MKKKWDYHHKKVIRLSEKLDIKVSIHCIWTYLLTGFGNSCSTCNTQPAEKLKMSPLDKNPVDPQHRRGGGGERANDANNKVPKRNLSLSVKWGAHVCFKTPLSNETTLPPRCFSTEVPCLFSGLQNSNNKKKVGRGASNLKQEGEFRLWKLSVVKENILQTR